MPVIFFFLAILKKGSEEGLFFGDISPPLWMGNFIGISMGKGEIDGAEDWQ